MMDTPEAHPRSRGENELSGEYLANIIGSSPLTRGKPKPDSPVTAGGGLIPAHAGKTAACAALTMLRAAHPRSRGENRVILTEAAGVIGSSPLTRGKLRGVEHDVWLTGLIPAHAGKTCVS